MKHEEPPEEKKSTEQPACDPALGDLTPAYIEWFKKNHPDEFEAKYKGRIPEETPKQEEDSKQEETKYKHK